MKLNAAFCLVFIGVFLCAVAVRSQNQGLDPFRDVSQYHIEHFTTNEGLPSNGCINLFEDSKGFLWVATYGGLLKYDGTFTHVYSKKNIPHLKNNAFQVVREASNGKLAVGTHYGLLFFENGKWSYSDSLLFKKIPDKVIDDIYPESDGGMWIVTNAGMCYVKDTTIKVFDLKKQLKSNVIKIKKGSKNRIWVTDLKTILYSDDRENFTDFLKENSIEEGASVTLPIEINNGDFFFSVGKRLYEKKKNGEIKMLFNFEDNITATFLDRQQSLWIGTDNGLYRYVSGNFSSKIKTDLLKSYHVRALQEDREGNLWVATYRNGLLKISNGSFLNYGIQQGLPGTVSSVSFNSENKKIYAGTTDGVYVFNGNKFEKQNFAELRSSEIKDIYFDKKKRTWICTRSGFYMYDKDGKCHTFEHFSSYTPVYSRFVLELSNGKIWVGTTIGIYEYDDESKTLKLLTTENGLVNNYILWLFEDKNKAVWVSTRSGLCLSRNGKFEKFDNQDLASGAYLGVGEGSDGDILVGNSRSGLSVFKEYNFIADFSDKFENFEDKIFATWEDEQGNYWATNNTGIIIIPKEEKIKFMQSSAEESMRLNVKSFGIFESSEPTANARFYHDKENHEVWVATFAGVCRINTKNYSSNKVIPPVYVELFYADGERIIPQNASVTVLPEVSRIEIHYTAVCLTAPSEVKFRYKLEGFDKRWQETENIRNVSYTNLPPGRYVFKVIACNNDGLWNNKGAELVIVKKPFFWQTGWFWLILLGTTAGGIFFSVRYRIRSLMKRKEELELKVAERTQMIEEQSVVLKSAFEEIQEKNKFLESINLELSVQKQQIMDSINSARRIQATILPQLSVMKQSMEDFFVLFSPKDVVSGDFYWFGRKSSKDFTGKEFAFAVADCTGHGVPGALLSMLGMESLSQIMKSSENYMPDNMLRELDINIRRTMRKEGESGKEGMEVALCLVNLEQKKLYFSGANLAAFVFFGEEMSELKPTKKAINDTGKKAEIQYEMQVFDLPPVTEIFLMSDGLKDQFGGPENKKFMSKRIREILYNTHHLPMAEIKRKFEEEIRVWKGREEQTDDITIMGVRIKFLS
jgi:ligand-binding sensor domain-containing protein/serine phosphatase RsbU (regulator of sigma subunit)